MASYLLEGYSPVDPEARARALSRIRVAAHAMAKQGLAVRHVRTILVPGDETSFHLVEAPSLTAVEELVQAAGLSSVRIVEALDVATD
jgi:hypothetical protein